MRFTKQVQVYKSNEFLKLLSIKHKLATQIYSVVNNPKKKKDNEILCRSSLERSLQDMSQGCQFVFDC